MIKTFEQYQSAGLSVIPVNQKVPLIKDWNKKTTEEIEEEIEVLPAGTTGIGILIGQRYNRRLACMDVDTNDAEICERLIANFPLAVRAYGKKGFKAFFLTDGEQQKGTYKYPVAGGGFIEVFYENRQMVIPPSLHSDDIYYVWDDDASTLLTVDYDDLPVIPFSQIETIPTLIGSPTVTAANKNLPAQLQYSTDDVADGRYGAMIQQLGRIFKKYHNRPKLSQAVTEILDFDAIHCPKNSFFLHMYNKKRAEIKTNDRAINAALWVATVARTFLQNSGATFSDESDSLPTESIQFNPFMPLEEKLEEGEELQFDINLIPPVWRKMITDMSEATSVPPFPIFMAFLAALGAAAQTKYKIQPKPMDEFHQYPNLAVCMVADSGSMKSDITSMANRMNKIINKEIKTANKRDILDEQQRLQARIEHMIKQSKTLSASGQMDEAREVQKELLEVQRQLEDLDLSQTEWMIEMSSIQKITLDAKNNQDNGLYFDLDEFKQIQALVRKKGNEEARTFLMKGVDGNKDYSYSTLARGKDYIERHIISILTSIQPDVLSCHVQDMHNPRLAENDGFYQRFLFCSFGEMSNKRAKDINYSLYKKEYDIFRDVFNHKPGKIHVQYEAHHTYDDIRQEIKLRAHPFKGTPYGSAIFKHQGLLCRFACLYEILLNESPDIRYLTRDSILNANKLLEYQAYDMRKIYKAGQDAIHRGETERVLELIKNQVLTTGKSVAEWNRSWRTSGSRSGTLFAIVDELEMRGYVATAVHRTNGKIVFINPAAFR